MKKIQALLSLRQPSNRLALVAAVAVAPMAAYADPMDVTALTTALTAAGVACAAIGTAYLVVVVGVKSYKLIRSAM
jgi:Inovirus Coat protein B